MILVVRVVGDCHCNERQEWQRTGVFFYAQALLGYVFADIAGVPRRKDHRPYVWHDCPWCGGDLHTDD